MSLVVVDTGVANLSSVKFAFNRLGVEAVISDKAETITSANRVILPGVGAAPYAMKTINAKGLTPVLQSLTQPVMGICLRRQKNDPLLEGITDSDYAYFVHSYAAPISDITLASSEYGEKFSAIVRYNNVYGCQFHPERSSRVGAKILENFLKVPA